MNKIFLLVIALALMPPLLFAQKWQSKQAVLMSKFAKNVKPESVLPEYPRPQMVRVKWYNLNGIWQYQPGVDANDLLPKGKLSNSILVPFPVESALSGVMEHHDRLWYRRTFSIPVTWKSNRVLLHFGAVDYEAEIFVNGKSLGIHKGGYDPFSFDITDALTASGKQELTVRVFDPTDAGGFPRGKQSLNPQGIMYTSVTGIWQTVWLEPVVNNGINNIKIVPDVDKALVNITVNTPVADGYNVNIKVKEGNKILKISSGKPNIIISVPVINAKLWSPDHPFLYDLEITLQKDGKNIDELSSYFGMRKISVEEEGGFKKLFLNNKFLFQIGPLDQGFWPDGGYTAPTDEALKYDLQMIKNYGFNMVRKHIKVEPYRWYYWADKLGLLVWQDMPSANSYTEHTPPVDKVAFAAELTRLVETHWNSPSIINWVIFNEGQAQHNTPELVSMVKKLDPTRLINQASGGGHFGAGDILDVHSYPPPAVPYSTSQALACGEYGGIGFIIPGHIWQSGPTYIMIDNEKDYTNLYDKFANDLIIYKTNNGLSAAVYTEITDVEVELNGLLTYDRVISKGPVQTINKSNTKIINDKMYLNEILPSSQKSARSWKYTFDKPVDNWYTDKFNDADWKVGFGGFGTSFTPGSNVKTVWDTKNIWLRQEFVLNNLKGINKEDLVLNIHNDEVAEVYINGVRAILKKDITSGYTICQMSKESKKALNLNGKNLIAISCNQTEGGQYIDAGISIISKNKSGN